MIGQSELILICLVLVALVAMLARRIRIPDSILLAIAGVLLGLVPRLPTIRLQPELVFNLFLPPLIYPAAVFTSWRDFRANLRPILLLAVALVIATMIAMAALFHYLTGLPWAVGFVFGALISPPDAVAALSITQNLRVPRRIIVILEGESLVNDATSFISFRFAVAAVMTGAFSLGQATLQFLLVGTGGVAMGLAVGWLATQVQKRLDDPPVQTMLSLLTPYIAYFGGEKLHVSGILAVVIAGIYYGWQAPRILSGRMRLQALPVWQMVVFILNGLLFILIGLQLPQVIQSLPAGSTSRVAGIAIAIISVMVLVRFTWMFGTTYFPFLSGKWRRKFRFPWQHTALIAWTALRGADSLAAALAIPFVLPTGEPFPGRDVILLLTFCVIFGTLLLQGLSLTPIVRWLGVMDDHATEREERLARLKANEAALTRLEAMDSSHQAKPETIARLRAEYLDRIRQLRGASSEAVSRLFSPDFEDLACELLQIERETVVTMRNEKAISDQALRRIQRDIDLAEARLQRPV